MSFRRYQKYKDSGVEWLGEVPEHWEVDRFKRSMSSCRNGIWGDEANGDQNDIPCVRVADFDRQRLRVILLEPTLRNVLQSERVGRVLRRGDLLIEKSGGGESQPVGCVVLYDDDQSAVCSNFIARAQLASGMDSSFWRYMHASAYVVRLNTRSIKQTSGIQNLDQQQYFDERAPFPPHPEQVSISAFLDRETGKIDALIAEQRRLIELLQEKRQAVISHAVTKGLNPDAPMKDSGIEWLGMVPEHWEAHPLKTLFTLKHGYAFDGGQFSIEGEAILMTPGNFFESGGYRAKDPEKYYAGNDFPEGFVLSPNDLLVAMTEQAPGLLGSALFVPSEGVFLHNQRLGLVSGRRCELLSKEFLFHLFNSYWYRAAVSVTATGQKVRHTSPQKMLSIGVCLPPLSEQREIVRSINQQTDSLSHLEEDADRAITLLQERRSALISAAVTGQIDVRHLAETGAA